MIDFFASLGSSVKRVLHPNRNRLVRVEDMAPLGAGAHLVVVGFGTRHYLLAVGKGAITCIAEDLA